MRGWLLALLAAAAAAAGGSGPLLVRAWEPAAVQAKVWRPSAPDFVFPELLEGTKLATHLAARDDFGIALAGGGERGFSLAHGAARAMRKAGILSKARYFSTTSGSIWLSTPMYYQTQDSLESFLGESLSPEQLTPEVLTGDSAGKAITRLWLFPRYPKGLVVDNSSLLESEPWEALWDLPRELLDVAHRMKQCIGSFSDLCTCLVDLAVPNMQELWAILSGFAFLHPHGLAARNAWHCHETEAESLRAQLGSRHTIYAAKDISQGLPFPIMQSSVLPPIKVEHGNDTVAAFPLEHTPLYTGTPGAYAGARAAPYAAVGDAYVSSFAWPGQVLEPVPSDASSSARVARQLDLLNLGQLAQATGVATSYISDFQGLPSTAKAGACEVAAFKRLLPEAELWSPLGTDGRGVPRTEKMPVGDAGIYDDLGHIPLLRRGVSKMVIYDSAAIHDNSTGRDEPNLCEMTYLRAAFGQPGCLSPRNPPGAPVPLLPEGFSTVFEPSEFAPLREHIRARRAAGEPAVYRGKFSVVDNEHLGIKGGRQVEIVFVVLLPSETWRSALPARTAPVVKDWFPNFGCAELKSRMVFSLASQFASWVTEELVLKEVQAMLANTEPSVSIVV